jgi:hypothetical protein
MARRYVCATICIAVLAFAQYTWLETTQSDFADGMYERNIYASHLDGGTVEFAPRFDLNGDGYIDLYTADRFGPYVRVYWGSASGYLSGNVTLFPSSGGANCDVADLDGDGYPEFVVSHYFEKTSIYWGSATGPNPGNYLDFPMLASNRQGVFVADLDKDGYLDITVTQEITPGCGAILWGSASGYDINNRTDLPCIFGVHNIEVADFNKDTWLDILFVQYTGAGLGQFIIYWGSSTGFLSTSPTTLIIPSGGHGVSVADLNNDSYLDLISTGWYDPVSYIYWGSETGYSLYNVEILNPGYCYGGSAVADMNDDTYLDILYHRGGYGPESQRIYWGSVTGYSAFNYIMIGLALETTGGLIADLNYDGNLDVFSNTRTPETSSYLFLGPAWMVGAVLPVVQDHHAMFREIGNVYTRDYYEDYFSSVFDAGGIAGWGIIEWDAVTPTGSVVSLWLRSGNVADPDTTWSDWQSVNNGDSIPASMDARYLQYMTRFGYTNPSYLPSLNEVSVTYDATGIVTGNNIQKVIGGGSAYVMSRPSPFRTETTIIFGSVVDDRVNVEIYDVGGKLIRSFEEIHCADGLGSVIWDRRDNLGRKVSAGIYLYRVAGPSTSLAENLIVVD